MKTTIKVGGESRWDDGRVAVEPGPAGSGRVYLTVESRLDGPSGIELTQDQAGVLIYALEVAAEAARIAADREAGAKAWAEAQRATIARNRTFGEASKG